MKGSPITNVQVSHFQKETISSSWPFLIPYREKTTAPLSAVPLIGGYEKNVPLLTDSNTKLPLTRQRLGFCMGYSFCLFVLHSMAFQHVWVSRVSHHLSLAQSPNHLVMVSTILQLLLFFFSRTSRQLSQTCFFFRYQISDSLAAMITRSK